jgi:hypothetical protein
VSQQQNAPFTFEEWETLKHCGDIINQWDTEDCNGSIQFDNDETPRYYYRDGEGCYTIKGEVIKNRKNEAIKRAVDIAKSHNLCIYYQGDCRGLSLYVYDPATVSAKRIRSCYSTMARAVL